MTAAELHELLHFSSFQEEAVIKLILQAHEILKQSSFKLAIHSPSGDTDSFFLTLVHLCEYKERIYIIDSHRQNKKNISLSSIIFKHQIINSLIGFHVLTGNNYISSFCRKEKAACF